MTPEEARKLADDYVKRNEKHEKKLLVRFKKYLKERKREKKFERYFKNNFLDPIKYSAKAGNYNIVFEISIYDDVLDITTKCFNKLKEMGYYVEWKNKSFSYIIKVSWNVNTLRDN